MYSTPKAYFLTFRTYGTWLHGDARGSVDRQHNAYESPMLEPRPGLESKQKEAMAGHVVLLTSEQRTLLNDVMESVCEYKEWCIHAINVRSNHIHIVVSAEESPEMGIQFAPATTTDCVPGTFAQPANTLPLG